MVWRKIHNVTIETHAVELFPSHPVKTGGFITYTKGISTMPFKVNRK